MLKHVTINLDSLLKSTLTTDQYMILLLIHKKEFKTVERLVLGLYGYSDQYLGEVYELLQESGWLKINGTKLPQDIEVRQKFLNLIAANEEVGVVVDWIDEYREVFKNTRAGGMGNKETCIKNMEQFLTAYPEYSKEDIIKASKYYVQTCAKDNYKYLTQADYFIRKQDLKTGDMSCKLLTYLEETKGKDITEPSDYTKSI